MHIVPKCGKLVPKAQCLMGEIAPRVNRFDTRINNDDWKAPIGNPILHLFGKRPTRLGMRAKELDDTLRVAEPIPKPLLDLAEAMTIVRDHAAEWLVDPDKVATLGFSAGGYLCASYANAYAADERLSPNASILCYPLVDFRRYAALGSLDGTMVLGQVTGDARALAFAEFMRASVRGAIGDARLTPELMDEMSPLDHLTPGVPPTFVWTTFGDSLVDPAQSIEYALRLRELKVPCELHVFGRGEHGLSLADETTAKKPSGLDPHLAHWATLAAEWLRMTLG